jgi:bis(5'-nucleosyl)-tetraphosphatase (symmetrical)
MKKNSAMKIEDFEFFDKSSPKHITLPHHNGRIFIVGDIHGCYDEFCDLLDKYRKTDDVLILAGDLVRIFNFAAVLYSSIIFIFSKVLLQVNKGPKSVEVLQLARKLGAYTVVGNHEVASLRAYNSRAGGTFPDSEPKYRWTDSMSAEDIDLIRKMPFTINIPQHNAIVVHAGLVPGVELDRQNPLNMVTMRNLLKKQTKESCTVYDALETDAEGAAAWASVWAGPAHIYFGHDAKRRLQRHPFATGLDTGCVYGDRLSAAILQPGSPPTLVHVPARAQYSIPPAGAENPTSLPALFAAVLRRIGARCYPSTGGGWATAAVVVAAAAWIGTRGARRWMSTAR